MRILHFLFSILLVFLLTLPDFSKAVNNPVSCYKNGGSCTFKCGTHQKYIGTCGFPFSKCCR
ncbi:PREDICTED: beta-defensin 8-like [Chinchilla lanigera]|uniref:beta-defensin 8-like n=1 Tax=Chinchilla lanigera TaxID=34839 RepID=UPI00038EDF77|nr:PREDICTED: beta-defensin 8-like [Chinchilla lanigera]